MLHNSSSNNTICRIVCFWWGRTLRLMSIRYKTLAATTRDTIETRASGEEQWKDLFELKQLHSIISNNATLQQ